MLLGNVGVLVGKGSVQMRQVLVLAWLKKNKRKEKKKMTKIVCSLVAGLLSWRCFQAM